MIRAITILMLASVGCGQADNLPPTLQAKYDGLSEADRILIDSMGVEERRQYLALAVSIEAKFKRSNQQAEEAYRFSQQIKEIQGGE